MIYPDDLLHADLNGVTTIPKEIAAEIAEVGDAFVAAEAVILDTLHQFGSDPKKLQEARKESKRQMDGLRKGWGSGKRSSSPQSPSPKSQSARFQRRGCLQWIIFLCDNRCMTKHFPPQDAKLRAKLRIVARQMRLAPTQAEDLLWKCLRTFWLSGYKFRRQHAIDRFIVDFYCPEATLIIEVDGDVHLQQVEADQEREQILADLGFRVIRFTNAQVLGQTDQVLQQILNALADTPSLKSGFDDFGEGAGG